MVATTWPQNQRARKRWNFWIDSINYRSDRFADICTPRSARHVGNLMVAALLAAVINRDGIEIALKSNAQSITPVAQPSGRLRLRGLSGVRDEFHLAPIVRNLKTMALRLLGQPPDTMCRQLRNCALNNGAVVHRPPPNSWRDRLLPSSNH